MSQPIVVVPAAEPAEPAGEGTAFAAGVAAATAAQAADDAAEAAEVAEGAARNADAAFGLAVESVPWSEYNALRERVEQLEAERAAPVVVESFPMSPEPNEPPEPEKEPEKKEPKPEPEKRKYGSDGWFRG
jgi:outer membrane biosynthesis protein TonB